MAAWSASSPQTENLKRAHLSLCEFPLYSHNRGLMSRTDRDSAVTWRWDENDPGLLFPRVDGSDLCLSTTDEIVETGRQIVLAKCPSLPWEFSYFVSKAFRIKSRGLCEYCRL